MKYETPVINVFTLEKYDIIKTSSVYEGGDADQEIEITMGVNFSE